MLEAHTIRKTRHIPIRPKPKREDGSRSVWVLRIRSTSQIMSERKKVVAADILSIILDNSSSTTRPAFLFFILRAAKKIPIVMSIARNITKIVSIVFLPGIVSGDVWKTSIPVIAIVAVIARSGGIILFMILKIKLIKSNTKLEINNITANYFSNYYD